MPVLWARSTHSWNEWIASGGWIGPGKGLSLGSTTRRMPVVRHLRMAGRVEVPPVIDTVPVRVVAVLHEEEAALS